MRLRLPLCGGSVYRSPLKTLLTENPWQLFRHISHIFLRVALLRVRKIVSSDEKLPHGSLANRVFRGSLHFDLTNESEVIRNDGRIVSVEDHAGKKGCAWEIAKDIIHARTSVR